VYNFTRSTKNVKKHPVFTTPFFNRLKKRRLDDKKREKLLKKGVDKNRPVTYPACEKSNEVDEVIMTVNYLLFYDCGDCERNISSASFNKAARLLTISIEAIASEGV